MARNARHLILASATGYSWSQISPFVDSLRRSGFAGNVLMLIGPQPADVPEHLRAAGIQMWPVHPWLSRLPTWWRRKFYSRRFGLIHRGYPWLCDRLPLPAATRRLIKAWLARPFHHIACSRYFFYLSFLTAHARDYDRVMLSDVRDVLFQEDPFSHFNAAPLQFFLEHRTVFIGQHSGNANWVRGACSEAALAAIADHRVSCSGITLGSTAGILRYLAAMTDQLALATPRISGFDGYDQGVHNHLIWTGAFPDAELFENNRGPVLSMHGMPSDEIHCNDRGQVVGDDGHVIPVLHQYDRHPALRDRLLAALTNEA